MCALKVVMLEGRQDAVSVRVFHSAKEDCRIAIRECFWKKEMLGVLK